MEYFLYYIVLLSVIAVIVTCYDKIAAKRWRRHRVPEATLMILSLLGGSAAMLLVMLIIHHKTRHKKFMIGIPLILLVQIVIIVLLQTYAGIPF